MQKSPFSPHVWHVGDPARTSLLGLCQMVHQVLAETTTILQRIPWEYLHTYGGRQRVIQTLYDAACLNEYPVLAAESRSARTHCDKEQDGRIH